MKKTDTRRNKKYSTRPLCKFSCVSPYFYLTTRVPTARRAWKFIGTIIKDFFFLQMAQQLHITKRPVVNVETEIDEKIPFSPSHIGTYMSFVAFFVRPISMLKKRLGYRKAVPYINLYLKFLTKIYKNAATIYRFSMSTTSRPRYKKDKAFITIRIFDPHLLCVPSIHVAIAAGSYAWFKQLFQTDILPPEEAEMRLKEIETQAIAIVESVLFVKQHSVNCVPLALYMLSSTMNKSFFSTQDATAFIDLLFRNSNEITEEDKKIILNHFHYMYERALLESYYSDDWQSCIKHWIVDYARETGQYVPSSFTNDVF